MVGQGPKNSSFWWIDLLRAKMQTIDSSSCQLIRENETRPLGTRDDVAVLVYIFLDGEYYIRSQG